MRKTQILFIAPGYGNGGIRSLTKKMTDSFSNEEYELVHVGVAYRRAKCNNCGIIKRAIDGLLDLYDTRRAVRAILKQYKDIAIMHTMTSGSLGTFGDYVLGRLCKRNGIKIVMHCHYGCISEDYNRKGLMGWFLRKTIRIYDQIWVLDTRSYKTLNDDQKLNNKIHLTPNPIHVTPDLKFNPRKYEKIAFVGNLIPSKGLYELIEAVKQCSNNTVLTVVGPGDDNVVTHIKQLAGELINTKIRLVGSLPNQQAIEMIKSMDIIALPTYYQSEAFPISILEAMSYGKMVISTPRAAIKDMLTALDGTECGCLVRERSVDDIAEAIKWCQLHPDLADERCQKAYDKVYNCYRTDVIYDLYRSLYKKVLSE